LIRQLKLHEGVKLKAYKCTADKTTIGVGRNLDDLGITEEEADYLLANDIDRVKVALSREIPWMADLNDVRQRVLLDMAFNLGVSGLMQFKKTLKAIQDKDFERAGRMMLDSKWATQVGKRADRLSVMMNIGKDPKDLWPPTL
jgi:lysozyme